MLSKLRQLIKWIAVDGLLHFLTCYAIMLTLTPVIGVWWAILTVCLAALGKEAFDFFIQKDNDMQAVIHDIILDALGILMALVTMGVWMI